MSKPKKQLMNFHEFQHRNFLNNGFVGNEPLSGKVLRDTRTKAGLSQRQAAKLFNIPIRTLQNWEQDLRTPPAYIQHMYLYAIYSTFLTPPEIDIFQ